MDLVHLPQRPNPDLSTYIDRVIGEMTVAFRIIYQSGDGETLSASITSTNAYIQYSVENMVRKVSSCRVLVLMYKSESTQPRSSSGSRDITLEEIYNVIKFYKFAFSFTRWHLTHKPSFFHLLIAIYSYERGGWMPFFGPASGDDESPNASQLIAFLTLLHPPQPPPR